MLKIVSWHKAKAVGTNILAAKEPVATAIFSQANKVGISNDCHLPGIDSLEVLDGFPDGESLWVCEGEQEAMV
jgi:hypothetical protein